MGTPETKIKNIAGIWLKGYVLCDSYMEMSKLAVMC